MALVLAVAVGGCSSSSSPDPVDGTGGRGGDAPDAVGAAMGSGGFGGAGTSAGGGEDYAAADHPYYDGLRAFPGAEGYGATATGARGADAQLLFVTTLASSGPGSLRAALEAPGPRYVVPLIWGEVSLDDRIEITDGRLTFAGQFMPEGQGLVLQLRQPGEGGKGAVLYSRGASNLILRYLKIYRGYHPDGEQDPNGNALTLYKNKEDAYGSDVIVDHYAFAFTTDNMHGARADRVTFQHGAVMFPLHRANHPKGPHGKGPLLGYAAEQVTYHHNFLTTFSDRHPMLSGHQGLFDASYNYNFNTGWGATFRNSLDGAAAGYNYVGNVIEPGPLTRTTDWLTFSIQSADPGDAYPQIYLAGNDNHLVDADGEQWTAIRYLDKANEGAPEGPEAYRVDEPFDTPALVGSTPQNLKNVVLAAAGPSCVRNPSTGQMREVRDSLLSLAVAQARDGQGFSEMVNGYDEPNSFVDIDPDVPEGSISEAAFFDDYLGPWRDIHHPGASWDDFVDTDGDGEKDYQLIEAYLNTWVPPSFADCVLTPAR